MSVVVFYSFWGDLANVGFSGKKGRILTDFRVARAWQMRLVHTIFEEEAWECNALCQVKGKINEG